MLRAENESTSSRKQAPVQQRGLESAPPSILTSTRSYSKQFSHQSDTVDLVSSNTLGISGICCIPFATEGVTRTTSVKRIVKSAALACESVGYDLHESKQYVKFALGFAKDLGKYKGGLRWILLCAAGVLTGLVAISIQFTLHHLFEMHEEVQSRLTHQDVHLGWRCVAWVSIRLAFAAVASLFVCFIEPLAGGSGIPEIKCFLNGVDVPNVLRFRTLICKACGIIFSVASGLPCGKEGPMIHSGAIVGAAMTGLDAGPLPGPFRQTPEARDMTAAGAAAGVAAAFGAPIGGVLFTVEEGASHMNPRVLVRSFVASSMAALTVRLFLGPFEGRTSWGILGTEVPVEFGRFKDTRQYQVQELLIFALMGIGGGLIGAAFNAANTRLSRWRKQHIGPRGLKRFLEVLLVAGTIATLNFFAPVLVGGSSVMEDFSPTQRLFVQSGNLSIRKLLHDQEDFDTGALVLFAIMQTLETCWTYGLGVPSGLFVPSLLSGAAIGRLVGQFVWNSGYVMARPGVYALIGATAFLSGMARITISLAVILMETTGEAEWGLPIFLTVMAAKWTGDCFNEGLYDIHIHLKKVPLLKNFPEKDLLQIRAHDVMASNVVALEPCMKVKDLFSLLQGCKHHGFPVVEPRTRRFHGLLQRSTLHHVLRYGKECRAFACSSKGTGGEALPHEVMVQNGFPAFPSLQSIEAELTTEDLKQTVNLEPYTNTGCFTVQEDMVVARCFMLFRALGLRHLPVLNDQQKLCGIITRKDLIIEGLLEEQVVIKEAEANRADDSYPKASASPETESTELNLSGSRSRSDVSCTISV
eukprot:TRINITY_DN48766_c0_g1_i1.p1 TRINITY_DN48766_c0_g1~~TRINITY_DN48766_c0_g1_i1.p1  ORF type:complete len:811 (+),score=149.84 TRINITY_DN48766_c0_g1_i1:95-2527(+)